VTADVPRANNVAAEQNTPLWRRGAAAVAMLTFAVDGEAPVLAAGRRHANNAMAMTHQAFDARRGLPRLLGILDEFGIKATFFVPGLSAERWPEAISDIAERGHDVAHHSYTHRPSTELSVAEERWEFERGFEALERLGITPSGYRSRCGRRPGTAPTSPPNTGSPTTPV